LSDHIHVSRIHPNPSNIRDDLGDLTELTDSIRAHGILQPLVVRVHPARAGGYEVIAGHRRLAAAKRAKLTTVPVVIRRAPDDRALEVMLVENCQRRDLTTVEKAEAMGALVDRGYTAATIGRRTGLSPSTVSYHLALLDLDAETRERVAAGTVRVGDAIAAVRKTRKQLRGGTTGRKAHAEPAWFTSRHRLAKEARALCDHPTRPQVGNVACGQCWEQVIRDDDRDRETEATAAEKAPTAREERIEFLSGMRLHTGNGRSVPPGEVTAREAAERLGVTPRTVERYKSELAAQP
jgi:ParB family transcriptional regulator, chromosome partitioning protein